MSNYSKKCQVQDGRHRAAMNNIIHNNVICAIFGVITGENFNQWYSAPRCAGATVRCWLVTDCLSAVPQGVSWDQSAIAGNGEASHSNRSCYASFNDLHYSNRCRFIGMAWPVAMVVSLPLNSIQNNIIYKR
jgi:hypothetical protein